jgi:hypothetical protein
MAYLIPQDWHNFHGKTEHVALRDHSGSKNGSPSSTADDKRGSNVVLILGLQNHNFGKLIAFLTV